MELYPINHYNERNLTYDSCNEGTSASTGRLRKYFHKAPSNNSSIEQFEIDKYKDDKLIDTKKKNDENNGDNIRSTCKCSECAITPNPDHEEPDGCCNAFIRCCRRQKSYKPRIVNLPGPTRGFSFPPNIIRNQKYSIITFIPKLLFEQFSYFVNFTFLVMACSQFIPSLRINYMYTYWAPLGFVLGVTMIREMVDDICRWKRDREVNQSKYIRLSKQGKEFIPSSQIQLGDVIVVHKDQRVPADLILLRTTESNGSCFIRTDQMDGETDWKLRLAVANTQALPTEDALFTIQSQIYAERPNRNIHAFQGTYSRTDTYNDRTGEESLNIEHTLWSSTVVASGTATGIVIYTGRETRAVMNSSQPRSKAGLLDLEVNTMTKILFLTVILLSLVMVAFKGFVGAWYKYYWRFFLLFAYIIPLALRMNLDMAKIVYSYFIMKDDEIKGTVVRSTTIPEDLGRISYLMSDKTGTLTKNEMVFKKLHLGSASFSGDTGDEVMDQLRTHFDVNQTSSTANQFIGRRLVESVRALALCHNVTPVLDRGDTAATSTSDGEGGYVNRIPVGDLPEAEQESALANKVIAYQASSPDEVALVQWTETMGVTLAFRDLYNMQIRTPRGDLLNYQILQNFPFTSETKRMGIIVRCTATGTITFYLKGADSVMVSICSFTDWLEEEAGNMAREGLRTLVVARKTLSKEEYADFEVRLQQAKMTVTDRNANVAAVVATLERDMELLCLTGVEDKLQDDVRPSLEILRNAGIRIWMLTGDKMETAECIAKSSRLVGINHTLHIFQPVSERSQVHLELNAFRRHPDSPLLISGESLQICLQYYEHEFVELACQCPCVIVCRCSPTQKAAIVKLIQRHTKKRTAAVGDGGNDVSMIQAADVGIGLEGKEGRQAAMAADFSLSQFKFSTKLLLVHGRYAYKNSAALSQFIIHRGIIISVMQAIFSAVFYFVSIPLFPGMLMVGYATLFTMFPVFSLVLDRDVTDKVAVTYPELYRDLTKGRELNVKSFFVWVLISIYQGGIIMYGALLLFEEDFVHIVSISFTALILTELLMVALTIRTWHYLMIVGEFLSLSCYVGSLFLLKSYFDVSFVLSLSFVWKVAVLTAVSCIPLFILQFIRFKFRPPVYSKLK